MTPWKIAIKSLFHYWRSNFAIAMGAAIATAVLIGALIVGDSMRSSLRNLMLDQLGTIQHILVGEGFFGEQLARQLNDQDNGVNVSPLILFPNGTVEVRGGDQIQRAANVNVLGIKPSFWDFDLRGLRPRQPIIGDVVAINQSLADQLGIDELTAGQTLTLRIPKPTQLPAESALGATDDLIESLVDLEISEILPDQGLGRFSLQPSQISGPNLFISIKRLQASLARTTLKNRSTEALCNAALISGESNARSNTHQPTIASMRPRLEDIGLSLKRVKQSDPTRADGEPIFDYWSLSSEKLVFSPSIESAIATSLPTAKPVLTYLANDIRKPAKDGETSGIPFSMISAIDIDQDFQLISVDGDPIAPLSDMQIVLNQWAAEDLDVDVGDRIELEYFQPETTHGNQVKSTALFTVASIAKLTEPDRPFQVRRRNKIVAAEFAQTPTLANDPDLTPTVPGVTDAQSIENWELPFSTAGKIRSQDDDYWNYYRTTPKAFISMAAGKQLFSSRFGSTTSFRIPIQMGDRSQIEQRLLDGFKKSETDLGLRIIPIRKKSLAASLGSTPFDALFLALSMFVILSALILVMLLFRLAVQGRAAEVGLMQAVGIDAKRVTGIWLREMVLVCLLGSLFGVAVGVGYGRLMIYGLKTWWVGAISTPFLRLSISPLCLLIGMSSGALICWATIWWSLRQMRRQSVCQLLAGQLENSDEAPARSLPGGAGLAVTALLVIGAVVLLAGAFGLSGDARSGAFMGAGFLILAAALTTVFGWLKSSQSQVGKAIDLRKLALISARRHPLRSVLTIGLVSVASFLIVAVSSFRLTPSELGTGGFEFVATSSRPLFADLNTENGQSELLGDLRLDPAVKTIAMRLKAGQDASCNNLYQATQPRVVGVPDELADHFDDPTNRFQWAGVNMSGMEHNNPWRLLAGGRDRSDDSAIPVIIDKNTANYSLKIFALGTIYEVDFDSGEKVKFEVVGFLSNTILQGSLLIGEADFKRVFPAVGGYRYFLIDSGNIELPENQIAILEEALGDQGFDAQSSVGLLANFMTVQNTYLSTFQSLGGLGLLLGTLGLAAVQIRSVIERTRELGLLRAVGFGARRIANLIFLETAWLLAIGLAIGIAAALWATLPHFLFGNASVPWMELALIFAAIILSGLATSYLAARSVIRRPILASLRD